MRTRWRGRVWRILSLCMVASMLMMPTGYAQVGEPTPQEPSPVAEEPPVTREGGPYSLVPGYTLTRLAGEMGFVIDLSTDPAGNVYYATQGCPYSTAETFAGRKTAEDVAKFGWAEVGRIDPDGTRTVLLSEERGQIRCNLNGVTWHQNKLYLPIYDEILEHDLASGATRAIISDLPWGDHFVNKVVFGPDGKGYFGIGTATNSGVVGADDEGCCWKLSDFPNKREILPYDVVVTGVNFSQNFGLPNDCTVDSKGNQLFAVTSAFVPYGQTTTPGQVIPGSKKANTTMNRFDLSDPEGTYEVFASGFRHPYGAAFSPTNGKLYVVDNGPDIRGCRPIGNGVPDHMWEVDQGDWAGWPEVFGGLELDNPGLTRLDGSAPPSIFTRESRPGPAEEPFFNFIPHTSSSGIAFSTSDAFGFRGDAFVAQFGSLDPATSGGPAVNTGKKVVRIDMASRQERDFLTSNNWGPDATGPRRPTNVAFSQDGARMYIADFGLFATSTSGPVTGYGAVWMVTRSPGSPGAPPAATQPQVQGTRANVVDSYSDPRTWGFQPTTTNVRVGETVTWVNTGVQPHTATDRGYQWDTGLIEPGSAKSLTFDREGRYVYFCKPHPWMQAIVTVSGADAGAPAGPAVVAPAPGLAPPPAAAPAPAPAQLPAQVPR